MNHPTPEELQAGLAAVLAAPKDRGVLRLIVRRPAVDSREVLQEGFLSPAEGLVGDDWRNRSEDSLAEDLDRETQLTIMNSRAAMLVAGGEDRWPLAGDQLYIDLDLGQENLPPGTRLAIGQAIVEVTSEPHTGCRKFVARFGLAAMQFVNSPLGRRHNLRGINAKVIQAGVIRIGDVISVIR